MRTVAIVAIIAGVALAGCRRSHPEYVPMKLGAEFAVEQAQR
jgi:hypothetical protein